MKKCSTCKVEKELTEFGNHSITKDGLRGQCKKCKAISKKQWQENNTEKVAASCKKWREENKEEISEYNKQWREEHKEEHAAQIKQWQKNNPDKRRVVENNRRARKAGNGGTHTALEWINLKEKCNYTCLCCGRKEPDIKLAADHIIPLVKGGLNSIDNIQPLCKFCNCRKHDKIIDYRNCFNESKIDKKKG